MSADRSEPVPRVRLAVAFVVVSAALAGACGSATGIEARAADRIVPSALAEASAVPAAGAPSVAPVPAAGAPADGEPTGVPTTVAAGIADQAAVALDESTDARGARDPDADAGEAVASEGDTGGEADAAPPPQPGTLAATFEDLARAWDLTNRLIFEADPPAFERVAAEIEQFVITPAGGLRIAHARLADDAYLAASLDDAGRVTAVVTLSGTSGERDAAVGFTSFAFALDDAAALRDLAGEYTEVVDGDPGERESFDLAGSAVVVEKRERVPGQVALVHAAGVTAAELEQLSRSLIVAVELAIGG